MKIKKGQYYEDHLLCRVMQIVKVYKTVPRVKIRIVKELDEAYINVCLHLYYERKENDGVDRVISGQIELYLCNKACIKYIEEFCTLIPQLKGALIYET